MDFSLEMHEISLKIFASLAPWRR